MIYILMTRLYFFVWTPETQNFNCMNDENIPLFHIDLETMNQAMDKKTPEHFQKAAGLAGSLVNFIKSLPGEEQVGAAVVEGPFHLGMAGAKFAEWKLNKGDDQYAPLNKILTELGINSTEND